MGSGKFGFGRSVAVTAVGSVLIALTAGPAECATWRVLGGDPDPANHTMIFGDAASVRTSTPNHRQMWITTVFDRDAGEVERTELLEFDCPGGRHRRLSAVARNDHGAVIGNDDLPTPWSYIPPDSQAADIASAACRGFSRDAFAVDNPVQTGRELMKRLRQ
ncbi:MAG TPA: surface-adhesin E family protein [Sphingobium sp.]|uniref:surface-adhesin E family protein n=1 Tax=Sphingobium sp. TaxID=1912891 RepID=UPI002EDDE9D9